MPDSDEVSQAEPEIVAVPALPIGVVLSGIKIAALAPDSVATEAFCMIKVRDANGDLGWSVRMSASLDDDELLGTLTGYLHHLRQSVADEWDDSDPSRPG